MTYEMKMRNAFQLRPEELAELSFAPWGEKAEPKTMFQGAFVRNKGFFFNLIAYEKEPLARFTKAGDPVWKDSCLELFINFAPKESDLYLNFEMNANGAALICTGNGRENRKPLATEVRPMVRAARMDDFWDIMLYIPLETVWEVYGKEIDFTEGYECKGNVYKCGDETATPHYLTWNPVEAAEPDFHRPECFGSFLLTK